MNTVNLIGAPGVGRSDLRLARWDLATGDLRYRTHWGFDATIPDDAAIWHHGYRYGCVAVATPFGVGIVLIDNGTIQRFSPLRLAEYCYAYANCTVARNAIALARAHGAHVLVEQPSKGLALMSADELRATLDGFEARYAPTPQPVEPKRAWTQGDFDAFVDARRIEARAKFERANKLSPRIVRGSRKGRRNARRRVNA